MAKKEGQEKSKLGESRNVVEPIDAEKSGQLAEIKILEKEGEDEYKETPPADAPSMAAAHAASGPYSKERKFMRAEEKEKLAREESLARWKPKTKLGILVRAGTIKDIDEVFNNGMKILEPEIVDLLLPNLKSELILVGQAKGKFGGGKRRFYRQTQKKTAEGNVPHFACLAVVGDENGHIGIGLGKAKETLPAKSKAMRSAKLSLSQVYRGCGSFDCSCSEKHSIKSKVEGKRGSTSIMMTPAAKGTGLVAEREIKKILKLAGLKDVYTKTFGQSRTKINHAGACFNALTNTLRMKR